MIKEQKEKSDKASQPGKIRLMPGVIIMVLLILIRFIIPMIFPDTIMVGLMGGIFICLAIIIWWVFFSRAPGIERWGGFVLMVISLVGVSYISHPSLAKGGMGMLFYIYALPVMSIAFVLWAILSRNLAMRSRRVTMVLTIILSCGVMALIQTGGVSSDFDSDFSWRWSSTPEELLLDQSKSEKMSAPVNVQENVEVNTDWHGFRGPKRDGIVHNVRINTNWVDSAPVELWRRKVGPAWSSFAVGGNLFYTQEQRGKDEAVTCYDLFTGQPVWRHLDSARFWESNGGAGPRGTPTLYGDNVYALGGTGVFNVLKASDGSVVWSNNIAKDTDTKVPMWGFSGSPLVVDDLVIVPAAGSLIAYDLNNGQTRWLIKGVSECYSSPHLLNIDGVRQVLFLNQKGAKSIDPVEGKLLWEYIWKGGPIVQPTLLDDNSIMLSVGEKSGVRSITVKNSSNGWTIKENWSTKQLNPYFNDSVVYKGHVFGYVGPRLACIDIKDGKRKWKGGRYGRGQLILLNDQGLLIVLAEKGDLALVKADTEKFTELARIKAIKGKTWNHPVLAGNILLVRNGQEMVAFKLSLLSK